ncbi:hypothetical protein BH09VER1_BH09VER1_44660 [soil metagenome]
MNEAIELHDSTLAEITHLDGTVVVSLLPAYLHRSAGVVGTDAGTGWTQAATITFFGAGPVTKVEGLPIWISDGTLSVGAVRYRNLIPARGYFEGEVELSLELASPDTVTIRGTSLRIELHGEARYVEEVPS